MSLQTTDLLSDLLVVSWCEVHVMMRAEAPSPACRAVHYILAVTLLTGGTGLLTLQGQTFIIDGQCALQ